MPVRLSAGSGFAAIALCVALFATLHAVQADRVNPIRRTISEYALGDDAWMFNAGVIGLAVGSLMVLHALVGARLLGRYSTGSMALLLWVATLLMVVAFEKTNWSIGPSVSGYIHRYSSLAAFIALPVAALALGRRWRRDPQFGRYAAWTRALGWASLGWLSTIFLGVFLRPLTGVPWYQFVPLGLVERGLALTEVVAIVVMGAWAWRAGAVRLSPTGREALPATTG